MFLWEEIKGKIRQQKLRDFVVVTSEKQNGEENDNGEVWRWIEFHISSELYLMLLR